MKPTVSTQGMMLAERSPGQWRRPGRLRTLDGVIMLSPDGRPASGSFPDNLWVVMGSEEDSIEDFFGPSEDILTAELTTATRNGDGSYCVGFNAERQEMVMNGGGAYPVYVSGLLRMRRKSL